MCALTFAAAVISPRKRMGTQNERKSGDKRPLDTSYQQNSDAHEHKFKSSGLPVARGTLAGVHVREREKVGVSPAHLAYPEYLSMCPGYESFPPTPPAGVLFFPLSPLSLSLTVFTISSLPFRPVISHFAPPGRVNSASAGTLLRLFDRINYQDNKQLKSEPGKGGRGVLISPSPS